MEPNKMSPLLFWGTSGIIGRLAPLPSLPPVLAASPGTYTATTSITIVSSLSSYYG